MIKRNKPFIIICLITATMAILLGAIMSSRMNGEIAEELSQNMKQGLNTGNNLRMLIKSISVNGKYLALLWILGLTNLGPIPPLFVIGAKCYAIGFTSAFLIRTYSLSGFLMAASSVFPHNLLIISAFLLLYISAVDTRNTRRENQGILFSPYTRMFILCSLITLAGSFSEAFVSSSLMRLIANSLI